SNARCRASSLLRPPHVRSSLLAWGIGRGRPALEPDFGVGYAASVRTSMKRAVLAAWLAAALAGCSSGPEPKSPAAPPQSDQQAPPPSPPPAISAPDPRTGFTQIVVGSEDSVGAIPGSA